MKALNKKLRIVSKADFSKMIVKIEELINEPTTEQKEDRY